MGNQYSMTTVEHVGYNIDGTNYFMIDDLAQYVSWNRTWEVIGDENSTATRKDGEVVLILGQGNKEAIPVTQTFKVTQNTDNKTSKQAQMQGYKIGGHEYYGVRDIAKLLEFSCAWDKESRCIELTYNRAYEDRADEVVIPSNIDALIENRLNETEDAKVMEGNDMVYVTGSGVYDNVLKCLKLNAPKNMDEEYVAGPYMIEESKSADGIPVNDNNATYIDNGFPAETKLSFYYFVDGYPTYAKGYPANFGYNVWVYGGAVKVVEQFGEWNSKYDYPTKYRPAYTEQEIIDMAVEIDKAEDLEIESATVVTYFDMKTLKFKYDVTMFYKSEDTYMRGVGHQFED